MSIQIPGTLVIKTITGRYGDFNTAKLSTSIGEFVIKDAVLDQYTAGRYEGSFLIQQIKPSYYSTAGGTLIVEIRAIAHVIVDKYQYGMPLYRQESKFKGLGQPVYRNNMAQVGDHFELSARQRPQV